MKKEKTLDVVFILDKSGSMTCNEQNTINSFNEYLEREKKNDYTTRISTVLFSDDYVFLHKSKPINEVKRITNEEYNCSGWTALYDAIGNTINYVDTIKHDKVLFVIITDGQENASKEYRREAIVSMIKKHDDYEFVFIGSDIDSYKEGTNIGISERNIASFKKNKKGSGLLFNAVKKFSYCLMEDADTSSWKEELDSYIEENKKDA